MIDVKICVGTNCSFTGSLDILEFLENDEKYVDKIKIETCKCFDQQCKPDNAPLVKVNGDLILKATLDKVLLKIGEKMK